MNPLLFYNDNGSKLTIAFPIKETLFERYLEKKECNYQYAGNYHGVLNKRENEYYNPAHIFYDSPLNDTLEKSKFYITRSGKFKSREYSNEYASKIYHRFGDKEPNFWGGNYMKCMPKLFSHECKII